MSRRIGYFARETLVSLRRNMHDDDRGDHHRRRCRSCCSAASCCSSRAVDHGTAKWKNGVELEIFMKVEGDAAADRRRCRPQLERRPAGQVASSSSPQDAGVRRASRSSSRTSPRAARERQTRRPARRRSWSLPTEAELTQTSRAGSRSTRRRQRRHRRQAGQGRCCTATRMDPATSSSAMAAVLLRVVAVPDRQHDPARHLRAPPRDRGDEARRRLELVRARAVHGRGLRAGRDRRRARVRRSVPTRVVARRRARAAAGTSSRPST